MLKTSFILIHLSMSLGTPPPCPVILSHSNVNLLDQHNLLGTAVLMLHVWPCRAIPSIPSFHQLLHKSAFILNLWTSLELCPYP